MVSIWLEVRCFLLPWLRSSRLRFRVDLQFREGWNLHSYALFMEIQNGKSMEDDIEKVCYPEFRGKGIEMNTRMEERIEHETETGVIRSILICSEPSSQKWKIALRLEFYGLYGKSP